MRHFLKRGAGHLVGISSIAALRGGRTTPAYNASKAFVSSYLEAMRLQAMREGGKGDISVTEILPGLVDTDMAQGESTPPISSKSDWRVSTARSGSQRSM